MRWTPLSRRPCATWHRQIWRAWIAASLVPTSGCLGKSNSSLEKFQSQVTLPVRCLALRRDRCKLGPHRFAKLHASAGLIAQLDFLAAGAPPGPPGLLQAGAPEVDTRTAKQRPWLTLAHAQGDTTLFQTRVCVSGAWLPSACPGSKGCYAAAWLPLTPEQTWLLPVIQPAVAFEPVQPAEHIIRLPRLAGSADCDMSDDTSQLTHICLVH